MKQLFLGVFTCLCLAQPVTEWTVFLRSTGPLRIGMTLAEARRALGDSTAVIETPADDPGSCGYLVSKRLPRGVEPMFVDRRLSRIDITSEGIRTASGAGVGDTEERIHQLYPGRIRVDPHHYTGPEGHYLRFLPKDAADSKFELLFETDGKVVLEYRAGDRGAVAFVEGCL